MVTRSEARLNRAVALRMAACGIIGLGAALLIAALLLTTYTVGKIKKIPLNIDTTLVSSGTGTALDPASLMSPHYVVDKNVPVVQQQQMTVETPANAQVVTLQVGTTLRRVDKQQDTGLLLAMVDTVTINRTTAMAVSSDSNPGGFLQRPRTIDDAKPPGPPIGLAHDGLSYRFPFNVEKKTYPYFDPIAQKAFDANYVDEADVNGMTTYHFKQNVGYDTDGKLVEPVKYPSLYDRSEDGTVTARASLWGLPGPPDDPITMTRYYAAQREFWVDPVSGTIVKSKEHGFQYYARSAVKPEVTVVDYGITSTEQTIESQINSARDERDRIALWGRILPITFTAIGVIALVGGGALGVFSLRTEDTLIDPGLDATDHGFFGAREAESLPGAEAETEKLPTRRPPPPPP
jgi:hypothetical protein